VSANPICPPGCARRISATPASSCASSKYDSSYMYRLRTICRYRSAGKTSGKLFVTPLRPQPRRAHLIGDLSRIGLLPGEQVQRGSE